LTAKYPEVFTFVGKEDEAGTDLSLTKVMVWQCNAVFQGEQKIIEHTSQINPIASQRSAIDGDIAEINNQLHASPENFENDPDIAADSNPRLEGARRLDRIQRRVES
jgi:glycine cleavage system H lipoate-binding protein